MGDPPFSSPECRLVNYGHSQSLTAVSLLCCITYPTLLPLSYTVGIAIFKAEIVLASIPTILLKSVSCKSLSFVAA